MKQRKFLACVAAVGILLTAAWIVAGPPGGDLAKQQPKYHIKEIPPAPVRTPEEELKTIQLPAGYRLELVLSEPDIKEPMAIAFDGNGRMYVVEMRTYMQDIDGTGELEPKSRVSRQQA